MGVIVRIGLPSLSLQLLYGSETNCSSPNIHLTRGPCSNLTRSACYSAPGEHHLRRQAADRSILRRRGHGPEEDPAITTRNSQQTPRKSERSPGSALTPRFHVSAACRRRRRRTRKSSATGSSRRALLRSFVPWNLPFLFASPSIAGAERRCMGRSGGQAAAMKTWQVCLAEVSAGSSEHGRDAAEVFP